MTVWLYAVLFGASLYRPKNLCELALKLETIKLTLQVSRTQVDGQQSWVAAFMRC